jgi:hypothetical protein
MGTPGGGRGIQGCVMGMYLQCQRLEANVRCLLQRRRCRRRARARRRRRGLRPALDRAARRLVVSPVGRGRGGGGGGGSGALLGEELRQQREHRSVDVSGCQAEHAAAQSVELGGVLGRVSPVGSLGEVRLAAVEHAQRRHHRVARAVRGRVVEAGLELLRDRARLAQGLELLVERVLQRLLLAPPPHLRLALGEHRRGLALDALALLCRRLQLLERQRAPAR